MFASGLFIGHVIISGVLRTLAEAATVQPQVMP